MNNKVTHLDLVKFLFEILLYAIMIIKECMFPLTFSQHVDMHVQMYT